MKNVNMIKGTGSILLLGDTHGRFDHVLPVVLEYKPKAIVFLGDIQVKRPFHEEIQAVMELTEVWWIHGNHDTDSPDDYDNLFASTLHGHNLHGRVVEVAGVRIAGLGGVFRERVWHPGLGMQYQSAATFSATCGKGNLWRGGLPLRHRATIFPEDYFNLAGQRADILVTHEAPSCHPHGFGAIDALAQSLGVKATFHGHHHDRLDYSACWPHLGFRAYGVGLRGVTALDGTVLTPGQQDEQRLFRQGMIHCEATSA